MIPVFFYIFLQETHNPNVSSKKNTFGLLISGTPDAIRTHGLWSRSVYRSFYFAQNNAIITRFIEIYKQNTNF